MTIKDAKKIYMIGIKGVGMTMLAQFLSSQGIEIIGSDTDEVFMTDKVLKKNKIKVIEKFDRENIPEGIDAIIYSTAYNKDNNAEVAQALKMKNNTFTYAEALASVFNQKYGIAVAGSHGKTTTSAWLGYVMDEAGKDPSVMVGAFVPQFDSTSLNGKSDYLIIEADEYQNKLKHYQPQAVLLNNIDYDHPDFFPSVEDYIKVFVEFIKKIPSKGFLVANFDDPVIRKHALVNCRGRVISYAINESADYVAYDIKLENGKQFFKVKLGVDEFDQDDILDINSQDSDLGDFSIALLGKHSIYNALAVITTCIELKVDLHLIRKYLEEFTGTARRMEEMGEFRGATIIDDYAHHPTEVKATIEAVKIKYPSRFIRLVFHPHTFTRTKTLLDDFAKSFGGVNELIVLDIYGSAREEQGGVHARDLTSKIKTQIPSNSLRTGTDKRPQDVKYLPNLKDAEEYLRENVERDDVVVLMGAGDVFRIGENLVK